LSVCWCHELEEEAASKTLKSVEGQKIKAIDVSAKKAEVKSARGIHSCSSDIKRGLVDK